MLYARWNGLSHILCSTCYELQTDKAIEIERIAAIDDQSIVGGDDQAISCAKPCPDGRHITVDRRLIKL